MAHFDLVAGHLVASLQDLKVPANLIDEVVAIVVPLRSIFEGEAAGEAGTAESSSLPPSVLPGELGPDGWDGSGGDGQASLLIDRGVVSQPASDRREVAGAGEDLVGLELRRLMEGAGLAPGPGEQV